jgi:hypothetical protein
MIYKLIKILFKNKYLLNRILLIMNLYFIYLDNSNWMSFVRPAKSKHEQNMIVDQIGDYLYFTTTRAIYQREELLVGYSTFYAHKRGLHLLPTG